MSRTDSLTRHGEGSTSAPAPGRPELLAPAGGKEALHAAIRYGADAVYTGADAFGLRAGAENFGFEALSDAVTCAHANGVRVYITANIYAHNRDIHEAERFFARMRDIRPDAFLISDPGLFRIARYICPDIDIHISTQANNTNYETCLFWHAQGAKRIVLARELMLEEIAEIRARIPREMEIECFVHGAMCMAYSGRCLLSANMAHRDANRGDCAQPCRWQYALVEEKRPGEYMPLEEDARGTYIMASKDLCMLEHLRALADAGIDSFKIEGRMKSPLYVATVTRAYRQMMGVALGEKGTDGVCTTEGGGTGVYAESRRTEIEAEGALLSRYRAELAACAARPLSTGFYFDKKAEAALDHTGGNYHAAKPFVFLGIAEETDETGRVRITQRNRFGRGDRIEIMKPDGRDITATVHRIVREDGTEAETAPHPKEVLYLELDAPAEKGDVLRMP